MVYKKMKSDTINKSLYSHLQNHIGAKYSLIVGRRVERGHFKPCICFAVSHGDIFCYYGENTGTIYFLSLMAQFNSELKLSVFVETRAVSNYYCLY